MLVDERLHCVAGEQRSVSREHHDRTCRHDEAAIRDARQRHAHRMTRAQLLFLHHRDHPGGDRLQMRTYMIASMPHDHHHMARLCVCGCVNHMSHEGATGDGVEHLRHARAHALALAGSEDHDRCGPGVCHACTLLTDVPAPGGGIEPPFTDSKSAVLPLDDPGSDRTLGPMTRHQKFTLKTSHRLDFTGYGTVTYGNVGPSGPLL